MQRKIKALRIRPCKHDLEHQIIINDFKKVGEYTVLRGVNVLHSACTLCEHEESVIVGGGYIMMGGVKVDK